MTRTRDTALAVLLGLALAAAADLALAQDHHARSPYAGMQAREVKALDAKTVDDLRAGRGMGLALAAELNGYPGPMHVLELADRLRLSPDQRAKVQQLFERMKGRRSPSGRDCSTKRGRSTGTSPSAPLRETSSPRSRARSARLQGR